MMKRTRPLPDSLQSALRPNLALLVLCPLLFQSLCSAFQQQQRLLQNYRYPKQYSNIQLHASATTKRVIYDGPEWKSLQQCLNIDPPRTVAASRDLESYGQMTIVVGTHAESGDRVVAIVADASPDDSKLESLQELQNQQIYKDSVANIPKSISNEDAIQTMMVALTAVYCAAPRVTGVGGADASSDDNSLISGKVGKVDMTFIPCTIIFFCSSWPLFLIPPA